MTVHVSEADRPGGAIGLMLAPIGPLKKSSIACDRMNITRIYRDIHLRSLRHGRRNIIDSVISSALLEAVSIPESIRLGGRLFDLKINGTITERTRRLLLSCPQLE
jgi:hypothetical protein